MMSRSRFQGTEVTIVTGAFPNHQIGIDRKMWNITLNVFLESGMSDTTRMP